MRRLRGAPPSTVSKLLSVSTFVHCVPTGALRQSPTFPLPLLTCEIHEMEDENYFGRLKTHAASLFGG